MQFPPQVRRYQVSQNGGSQPMWRGDGKELYFLAADGTMMAAELLRPGIFTGLTPNPLFRTSVRRGSEGPLYAATPDGQRFLIISAKESVDSSNVEVVLNWPGLLSSK
jgi:hypothetical protein